jgi:gamma-glutamylputrescine oxidase
LFGSIVDLFAARERDEESGDLNDTFCPISAYIDRPPVDLQPALQADIDADMAIIGGGYTGLCAALRLRADGVDVALLEREFCGFGASGRNAGHLTPTISKDIPTAVMMYGEEGAATLVKFADYCVETTEALLRQYQVDCDYHGNGNIMSVVHPSQEKRLRNGAEVARGVGADVRFLEPTEMRDRGIPGAFLCGALEAKGGTLNPGELVLSLRQRALEAGVRIYERTEALQILDQSRPVVRTAQGSVTADNLLIATNAYTTELARPGSRMIPLYVSMVETVPLSAAQRQALDWPGREGIYTAHESMESYRLTARGTLVGGSKGVKYPYGGQTRPVTRRADANCDVVIAALRDRFPELGEVAIGREWGGWIGMTLNFLPMIGHYPDNRAIQYAVGYNGHGVAQASTVGTLIAEQLLGRQNPWLAKMQRRGIWLPPEPLKWMVVKGLLGVLEGFDRRLDKKIRRASGRQGTA